MNRFRRSLDLRRRPGHDREPSPWRSPLRRRAPRTGRRRAGSGSSTRRSGQVANDLSFNGNRGMLGRPPGVDANDPTWVSLPKLLFLKRAALRFSGSQSVRMPDAPSLRAGRRDRPGSRAQHRRRRLPLRDVQGCLPVRERVVRPLHRRWRRSRCSYVSDGTDVYRSADAGAAASGTATWHTVMGASTARDPPLRRRPPDRHPGPAAVSVYYGMPTGDDFYIGDYGGPCTSPLGFVGDIDAAAVLGRYDRTATLG